MAWAILACNQTEGRSEHVWAGSPPPTILASIERPNLRAQPLDSRGQPWLLEAGDWRAVLRHLLRLLDDGQPPHG